MSEIIGPAQVAVPPLLEPDELVPAPELELDEPAAPELAPELDVVPEPDVVPELELEVVPELELEPVPELPELELPEPDEEVPLLPASSNDGLAVLMQAA